MQIQDQSWAKVGLLIGALILPGCTFKDTSKNEPPGTNSIENREAAPAAGTPDNPSNQQPQP